MTALQNALKSLQKAALLHFLNANPDCFGELLNLALSDNKDFAFRAAWGVGLTMEENDARLRESVGEIIRILPLREDGHKRVLLFVLNKIEIQEEFESPLFDFCIGIWEDTKRAPGLRSYAFQLIIKISKKYPELQNEIQFLTENRYLDTLSAGIRHSVRLKIKRK
ncbi:MAG: hypothetical protein LBS52_01555 [Dysgonamonadaceae bacterium]|jgi:hypothetical protein|nr:hypothetical protein [Dysgonamonadaceae bacterium]